MDASVVSFMVRKTRAEDCRLPKRCYDAVGKYKSIGPFDILARFVFANFYGNTLLFRNMAVE